MSCCMFVTAHPPLQVKLLELFKTPPTAVSHTSLSLLHERAVLDSDTGFLAHVNPMDIHTYRLTW